MIFSLELAILNASAVVDTLLSMLEKKQWISRSLGRENVLVLKQSGITPFSNMSGIVYESFTGENIDSTFERIRQELDDCLERLEEGEVE